MHSLRLLFFTVSFTFCYLTTGFLRADEFRGVVLDSKDINSEVVNNWKKQGFEVVCKLSTVNASTDLSAAKLLIKQQGFAAYLIEVGRVPTIADQHPELMASLQGHPEWRRFYPTFPKPEKNEVVKTYPWVSVLHEEGMKVHLDRIDKILDGLPAPKTVWLNNIQGSPSSCGCGNTLCRWTTDYGPKKTTTNIGDKAPGQFLGALKKAHNDIQFLPIFYPECEEGDKVHFCAGVGCFKGICWKAWSRQLDGLSEHTETIGAAAFFKALDRSSSQYGTPGSWVYKAVQQFQTMPPVNGHKAWPGDRIISILQGWDVSDDELQNQIAASEKAGAKGYLVVKSKLDQSWRPKTFKFKD